MNTDTELEKLKLLFDYTKFHIGLYTTIATIFGALYATEGKAHQLNFNSGLLLSSVIFLFIAGFAGGTIASSITTFSSHKEFWNARIGPMIFQVAKAEYWTYVEHLSFWIAMGL